MYCAIFIVYLLYQMCELLKIVLYILLCVYQRYLWCDKSGGVHVYVKRDQYQNASEYYRQDLMLPDKTVLWQLCVHMRQ